MDDELELGRLSERRRILLPGLRKGLEPDSILDLAKRMRERRRTRPLVTGTDLRNENGGT